MPGAVAAVTVLTETATRRIDILIRKLFEPLVFALVLGGIMTLFLLSLEIVTLLYTWIRGRRERHRERLRPDIRDEIFTRLVATEPNWTGWARSLGTVEQRVAREILDTYLRQLRGQERTRLQEAGDALDIPAESVAMIQEGDRHDRLRGLVWLSLLEHEIDPDMLWDHCRGDPTVRAGAARVLYATGGDDAVTVGTRLLCGTDQQMTSFGMDTLYRLHRDEPGRLFEYASEKATGWSEAVTVQVLRVVEEFTKIPKDAPTGWLVALSRHDSSEIRAATARAFVGLGWREDLRRDVSLETLAQDPSSAVRQAFCEMLASWNDDEARAKLRLLARTDTDPRVRLVAFRGLPDTVVSSAVECDGTDPVREWVAAERELQAQRA